MTDEETETARITQLVLNICDNQVFTDRHCREPSDIGIVFMVLSLAPKEQFPTDLGMVWEYMSEAAPRDVNGMPCFFSCNFETAANAERIWAGVKQEMERRKAVKF